MNRVLLIAFLLTCVSQAQWSTDPANNLIVGYGQDPQICSDGAGGCYITYMPEITPPYTIRVVRLNRFGYNAWASFRTISGTDSLPSSTGARITEDGNGGVIIAYLAQRPGFPQPVLASRFKVQRIDSAGNLLWGSTGVRVSLSETDQNQHAIAADGTGSCIVAWVDLDTVTGHYRLRLNRINSAGFRTWGDSGKFVWDYDYNSPSSGPPLIADGRGGCILLFGPSRAQRFSPSGIPLWDSSGIQLENLGSLELVSDGLAGAVLAGMRYISYNNGDPFWAAKTQQVDSLGQILWGTNGITLQDSLHGLFLNPPGIQLAKNADGSSTVAWGTRSSPSVLELRTQIVRANGSTIFRYGGIPVSRVASSKGLVGVVLSDSMRNVFVWGDSRTPGGMYAQRLDTLGQPLWDSNDVAVNFPQFGEMKVITDGNGGCIGVGFHQFDFSIRALLVNKYGQLGQVITAFHENSRDEIPHRAILYQNYPNPFNPETRIHFELPQDSPVRLVIYDLLGREVATLVNEFKKAGSHDVVFDAKNLASGVYFYRLQAGTFNDVKKLLLLR